LKATDAEFSGNVSVGGTLTYEDVTNIDSVGFITARKGSVVLGSGTTTTTLNVSGVSTFVGVSTFSGDVYIGGDLYLSDDLVLDNVTGNSLNISGISTFTSMIDANGGLDVSGISTFTGFTYLDDTLISSAMNPLQVRSLAGFTAINIQEGDSTSGTTRGEIIPESYGLTIQTDSGSDHLVLQTPSAGQVGIGSTQPKAKLDVNGSLNVSGVSTFTDDVTFDGATAGRDIVFDRSESELKFADAAQIVMGAGEDFRIFHDGYKSVIQHGGHGDLYIRAGLGEKIQFQKWSGGDTLADFNTDGSVDLYYDAVQRFSTSGIGATVFGQLDTTTLNVSGVSTFSSNINLPDGISAKFGTDLDGEIKHTGNNLQIQEATGNIQITNYANDKDIDITSDDGSGGTALYFKADGSTGETILYNYGSERLATSEKGIKVGTGVTIETNGQATFTGIVTFGSSSTTIDGDNNLVTVGTALTLGHTQGLQFHTQNLHATGFELNQLNLSGLSTFHDNVHLKDDKYLYFGNDDDSWVTFDGTNLQIRGGSNGTTYLRGNSVDIGANGGSGGFNSGILVTAVAGVSRVELYHDGNERLETTNSGVDVTGTLNATTFSGNITGTAATFTGDVTVGGTLTYDDVTNIDSVGIVTARSGIDCNGTLEVSSTANFDDTVKIADKIEHLGDSNTNIRFPAADTVSVETAGSERLEIDSTGRLLLGTQRTYGDATWYDDITINNSDGSGQTGGTGINLISSTNSWGSILFGDSADNNIGAIKYDHNTNSMRFVVNTIDPAVLITSAGRVGIGTDAPTAPLNVAAEASTGLAVKLRQDVTNKKARLIFQDYLTGGNDSWIDNENSNLTVYAGYGGLLKLGVYNKDAITIDSNRLVGVGTVATSTSSTVALQVHDATEPRVRLTNNTTTADAGSGAELNVLSDDLIIRNRESDGHITFLTGAAQNEALRITSAGRVGIGNRTTNPGELLHVHTASGAAVQEIEGATDATLILRAHSGDSYIKFADAASSNIGRIDYDHGTDAMIFRTNDDERLRIDSDGRLRIGNTTQNQYTAADDLIVGTGSGDRGITIYSGSSDAGVIAFSDGTTDTAYRSGQIIYDHIADAMDFRTNGNYIRLKLTSTGQLEATSAADVRLTLGSSGTAGTNDSVHVRADSADLKFMAASGGTTIFETNGTETLRIASSGQIGLGGANYGTTGQVLTSQGSGSAPIWSTSSAGSAANEIVVKDDGSNVGSAGTVNFGSGLDVSALSNGQVTITTTPGSGVPGISTVATSTFKDVVVTGVSTLGSSNGIGTVTVGVGTTALMVDGHARVTGPLTIGSGSITLDGSAEEIKIGNTFLKRDSSTGDLDVTDNEGNYKTIKMKGGNAVTQSDAIAFAIALG
jgi:hypothetical protein